MITGTTLGLFRQNEPDSGPVHASVGVNDTGLRFEEQLVTPEMARDMLARAINTEHDAGTIATYAQMMRENAWVPNAMPIIFDIEGNLVDGVQRLQACVEADTPFRTLIAWNVRRESLHTIDQHRRRTYAGTLEIRDGIRNAGALVRTMGKLIRIENGIFGKSDMSISWSRLDRVYDANRELLLEAFGMSEKRAGALLHNTARLSLTTMAIAAGRRKEIGAFLAGLQDDETLPADSPILQFNNQMRIMARHKAPSNEWFSSVDHAMALAILAFEDFCHGKSVRAPYFWEPDTGSVRLVDGRPERKADLMGNAPANLGFPTLTGVITPQARDSFEGITGLHEARFDIRKPDSLKGRHAEGLKEAAERNADRRIEVEVMLVDPETARRWMSPTYNSRNRRIQDSHVRMIARDIKSGYWQVNAQPVCFTAHPDHPEENPVLLNGQHRLRAIMLADQPIEIPIAWNVDPAAFATYDVHSKKAVRAGGKLKAGGESRAKIDDRVINAAARIQWREENGFRVDGNAAPTSSELQKTIENHPEFAEHFPRARRKGMADIASNGVMVYFISRILRERPDLAETYLDQLETGVGLTTKNPLTRMRNQWKEKTARVNRKEKLGMLLENWESYIAWREKEDEKDRQGNLV